MTDALRPIPGFPGYFASSEGLIFGPHGKPLPVRVAYPRVLIQKPGEPRAARRQHSVHVLVAAAFYGERPEGHDVDHIDGNPLNARAENLRYLTVSQNRGRNTAAFGPGHNARKTHCKHGHPFDDQNTYVRPNGRRVCRTCQRRTQAAAGERRRADTLDAATPCLHRLSK